MNKVWFIFRGDHHLGPFSAREILRMYEEGKITGQTLLWAEGDSGWKALHLQERLVQVRATPVTPKVAPKPKQKPAPTPPKKTVVDQVGKKVPDVPKVPKASKVNLDKDLPPDLPPLPSEVAPPRPSPKSVPVHKEPVPELRPPVFHPSDGQDAELVSQSDETEIELHAPFTDLMGEEPAPPEEMAPAQNEEYIEGPRAHESEVDSFYEDRGANKKTLVKWRWPLRAVALVMLLFFSYQLFFTNVGPFKFGGFSLRRLPGLSRDIEQQLHRFSRENRGQFKVSLALGHKGQVIWLSSGLQGQGMMQLRLTSKEGELLGSDHIEAWASAPYYGGAALFDSFKFIKGQGLIPGRYEAYLTYRPSGFWDGVKQRVNELLSRPSAQSEVLKFTYLYYLGPNDQFVEALSEYKNKLAQKATTQKQVAQAPLKLRLEFESTLKELSHKLINLYKDSLEKMKRGPDIATFTTRYAKEIEPLYRPLTLESKAKMEDPAVSEAERLAWEEIHKDYRSLGDLVSDMQSMTSRRGTIGPKTRERLLRIFRARAAEITAKAESEMATIMESIDPTPVTN